MRLSQTDLASLLDVSCAAVSQATTREHKCGGYPISAWAIYNGAGRVAGYDVPDHIVRQRMPEEPEPVPQRKKQVSDTPSLTESASALLDEKQVREILRTELERENPSGDPVEQGREDYVRPASVGGLSYVMGKAVDGDSGTARAAVISAAALFGGIIGHETSDHWAGALAGAILVGGFGWKAMQSTVQNEAPPATTPEPATETPPPDAAPSHDTAQDGLGGPIRAVGS